MTCSAVDDTLAPEDGGVLWPWGQDFPYELAGGQTWDDIGEEVANSLLDTFEYYAPGAREKVAGRLSQELAWLE